MLLRVSLFLGLAFSTLQCYRLGAVQNDLSMKSVSFRHCLEDTCYADMYVGMGCEYGRCPFVCNGDHCYHNNELVVFEKSPNHLSEIDFYSCPTQSCDRGDYRGYNCKLGVCEYVCINELCYHSTSRTSRPNWRIVDENHNINFKGCPSTICRREDYTGYGCENEDCELVCKGDSCYSDTKHYNIKLNGKARLVAELKFEDCDYKSCRHGHTKGYNCKQGLCKLVCDKKSCYSTQKNEPYKLKTSGKIIFDGCMTYQCFDNDQRGFGCHNGYCDLVCDKYTCQVDGKRFKHNFEGIARALPQVMFENCYKSSCKDENTFGYECKHGFCDFICEYGNCYRAIKPQPKKYIPHVKKPVKVVFESCFEDQCYGDNNRGFGCHNGHCDLICDAYSCQSNGKRYIQNFDDKARIITGDLFAGCYRSTCKNENALGYVCKYGFCDFVCKDRTCFRTINHKSKLPIQEDKIFKIIVFKGCLEDNCNENGYRGFGCDSGHCDLICDEKSCLANGKHYINEVDGKPKMLTAILFEDCFKSSCRNRNAFGYDCVYGFCEFVCEDKICYRAIKQQPMTYISTVKVPGKTIFEGCLKDQCSDNDIQGFGCQNGKCDFVCDKNNCHSDGHQYTIDVKGKSLFIKEEMFKGCHSSLCRKENFIGFDCDNEFCHYVCEDDKCYRTEKPSSLNRSAIVIQSKQFSSKASQAHKNPLFDNCVESRCQKGKIFGYNCKSGRCEFICENNECQHKGKALLPTDWQKDKDMKKVDIYFDGCISELCFNSDFDGFGCSRGKCLIVCDKKLCLNAEGHSKLVAVTSAPVQVIAPETTFDYGKELQKIQFSKFFNFGDTPFF